MKPTVHYNSKESHWAIVHEYIFTHFNFNVKIQIRSQTWFHNTVRYHYTPKKKKKATRPNQRIRLHHLFQTGQYEYASSSLPLHVSSKSSDCMYRGLYILIVQRSDPFIVQTDQSAFSKIIIGPIKILKSKFEPIRLRKEHFLLVAFFVFCFGQPTVRLCKECNVTS